MAHRGSPLRFWYGRGVAATACVTPDGMRAAPYKVHSGRSLSAEKPPHAPARRLLK
ncbi:hypothetical protein MYA_1839 [Burkholderia sp. KJ006]|nr:hypothetical protein MYA_1839 [Burkholderia sp. KJ006]